VPFANFFFTVVNVRYLQGMYAFGLVETGFYKEAEKCALKVRKGSLKFSINFVFGFLYRHNIFGRNTTIICLKYRGKLP